MSRIRGQGASQLPHLGRGSYADLVLLRLLRRIAVVAAMVALVYVARGYGRAAAALTAVVCLVALASLTIWLPRAAHRCFDRGDYGRSAFYYHVLRRTLLEGSARLSVEVSLAACDLARGDFAKSLRRLDTVDTAKISEAARSAWLNNRAYSLAREGRDPAHALDCATEAIELRPEVAGFRHTRGVALLALGRIDDAIRELDAVWSALDGADPPPLLEAERCFDLATAWARRGERDYARDYYERAHRAAPESPWADRAADQLGGAPKPSGGVVLPELV